MPPKLNKKGTTTASSWYHCETCDVHIRSRDIGAHETHCHNLHNFEFIRKGELHTIGVERPSFTGAELGELPSKCIARLVFVSEGAMRLAGFHIGQQVILEPEYIGTGTVLVRTIWPIPEKFLTTIFAEGLDVHSAELQTCALRVQALSPDSVKTAKSLHLQQTSPNNLTEAELCEVERLLKGELKVAILGRDSLIRYSFFNKPLQLQVCNWLPFEAEAYGIVEALEGLCLTRSFCRVTSATTVEIIRSNDDTAKAAVPEIFITKADIAGLDDQLHLVEEAVRLAVGFQIAPKGVKVSRAILLHGSTGCGKTMICEAICTELRHQSVAAKVKPLVIHINSEQFSKFLGETEKNLRSQFERAFAHYPHPAVIIVEGVHNLCPKYESNDMLKRVCATFANILDTLTVRRDAQRCVLLTTTSHINAVHADVRRPGRLETEVEIGAPTPTGRAAILRSLLRRVSHGLTAAQVDTVAQMTHGFVGADLANLICSGSLYAKAGRDGGTLQADDLHRSLLRVKPSAMREVLIESPNVRWRDIGGQAAVRLKLQQAIEWPLLHPEKFVRLGIRAPRGILMYGPPGCSKTMIAKALATESQLNFLSIKGPELFSMWVGESERAVRQVFRKARQVAPAIVFFDEIDAISGERAETGSGSSGTSVKERVLCQLLTELDGVEALDNVITIAATNRPDLIDNALLRPGRIDRIVYVGLPDVEARREILAIKLQMMPLAPDVFIEELVHRTAGYSGAELQAVCQEAALRTLEESFEAQQVTWHHFEYALNAIQPRTSAALLRIYDGYQKQSE